VSIRNLEKLFDPASIALVADDDTPGTLAGTALRNFQRSGFVGKRMLVSAARGLLAGQPTFPDVASLPAPPDLAVIATPPDTVPGIVAELGARGTRAAVILSQGFRAPGESTSTLTGAVLDAARAHGMRILGPGSVGLMVPSLGLEASFAPLSAVPGNLAFVSQSGGLVTSVLDWAAARGIGFSHVVALGDMVDVDFADVIDYLGCDARISAILLYVERIAQARKFMSAARAVARSKPMLAVKGGHFAAGAEAATSHLGALVGSGAVYDAAFRRAGMLKVDTLTELFDAVETLSQTRSQHGPRLAVVTNGGGPGVLATDAIGNHGLELAPLSPGTIDRLDADLPTRRSRGNPIDIGADAPPSAYAEAVKILLDDREVDGILALHAPTALVDGAAAADAVIASLASAPSWQLLGRNLVTAWLGGSVAGAARQRLAAARIATYETPDSAVRGFRDRLDYRRSQALLLETPAARPDDLTFDAGRVRAILRLALAAGRSALDPTELAAVLDAYGIAAPPVNLVADADAAADAARTIDGPVALKIVSPDIAHKSAVGGVALGLAHPQAVREEALAMAARVRAAEPSARLDGFVVQAMVARRDAVELFVGIHDDPVFGPALVVGQGGTTVELQQDTTIELPPLNAALARALLARTRVWRLLQGYRDRPPADIDAVVDALLRVAQLAVDHPELRTLELNPLLADADGVVAVDATMHVAPAPGAGARLAISPYPKELEKPGSLRDGTPLVLRPIRPEDEPLLQDLAQHMAPEDLRLRFFVPTRGLSHALAARLSQIDYDREMALIALAPDPAAQDRSMIVGVGRFSADPDNRQAEYAVTVRTDWKGRGLGWLLMNEIIAVARDRGIAELVGYVLRENDNMLRMCRALGFAAATHHEDPELVHVVKPLADKDGG
jgi:acetyltransferase